MDRNTQVKARQAFFSLNLLQNLIAFIQGRGDELAPRDGSNYFEKICLRGSIEKCRDKAWYGRRGKAPLSAHTNRLNTGLLSESRPSGWRATTTRSSSRCPTGGTASSSASPSRPSPASAPTTTLSLWPVPSLGNGCGGWGQN